jgi:amino acid transporter
LIVLVTIVAILVGSFWQRTSDVAFVGYSADVFLDNLWPQFSDGETAFSVFAVFFPISTGIMSGANLSGQLRDTAKSIPRGSLLAIGVATLLYIALTLVAGATIRRESLLSRFLVFRFVSVWNPLVIVAIASDAFSSTLISFNAAPSTLVAIARDSLFKYDNCVWHALTR